MSNIVDFESMIKEASDKRNEAVNFVMNEILNKIGMTQEAFKESPFKFEINNNAGSTKVALKLYQLTIVSYLIKEKVSYTENGLELTIKATPVIKYKGDKSDEEEITIYDATKSGEHRRNS